MSHSLVPPSVVSASSVSPQPVGSAALEWPRRIRLPASLDAFTQDAWTAKCRAHGFDVVSEVPPEGECIVVVPRDATDGELDGLVQSLTPGKASRDAAAARLANVQLVSDIVFTSAAGALGEFPGSLSAYRAVCSSTVICSTAVTPSVQRTLIACIQALGGRLDKSFSQRAVTHLIAAKAFSPKYSGAVRCKKPILSEHWVRACFREGRLMPEASFHVPRFTGCVVACVQMPPEEEKEMRAAVEKYGGQFVGSPSASPAPDHIISGFPIPDGLAASTRASIVGRSWVDERLADAGVWKEPTLDNFPVLSAQAQEKQAQKAEADRAQEARERELRQHRAELEEAKARASAEATRIAAEQAAEEEAARKEREVVYDPHNDLYLSGMQIFLFAIEPAQLDQLHQIIRFGGGTRLASLLGRENPLQAHANSNIANMVLVYGGCRREVLDEKIKSEFGSRSKGVDAIPFPIVHWRWLVECYRRKAVAPFASFELPPPSVDAAAAAATHTPTNGLFTARGSSPAPGLVRTTSSLTRATTAALQRTSSSTVRNSAPTPADVHEISVTDVTALAPADGNGEVDGPTNFSLFNQSLKSASKPQPADSSSASFAERSAAALSTAAAAVNASHLLRRATSTHALPPPAPTPAHGPVLSKIAAAASSSAGRPFGLFQDLRFVIEEAESYGDDFAPSEDVLLPALRFTVHQQLTVRKQLQDYGASFVHEARDLRSASFKSQMDFVIGSVCGSPRRTPRDFQLAYGNKAQFVSYLWVASCLRANRILPLATAAPNPCWAGLIPRLVSGSPGVPGWRGALRITSSGFSPEETAVIQACVEHAGAAFTTSLNTANTHLLFREPDSAPATTASANASSAAAPLPPPPPSVDPKSKRGRAAEWDIPIVHPMWLVDCLTRSELLDEQPYLLPLPAGYSAVKSTVSTRRSARTVTPNTAPNTPMVLPPDTPTPLGGTTPTPLPPSHFEPPASAVKPKPTRSSKRHSTKAGGGGCGGEEGTIDSLFGDDDDHDDDFGFGRGIQSALTHAPPPAATPEVRSKRGRSSAAAAAAAAATSSAEDEGESAGPQALSKKALFQQSLKQQQQPGGAKSTKAKKALVSVEEDEDDGEAEAFADSKPAPPAVTPRADDDVFALDDPATADPLSRPFQKRKAKAADAVDASPISLATASGIVAPVLLVSPSPKKLFKKNTPSRASPAVATSPAITPTRPSAPESAMSELSSNATTPASLPAPAATDAAEATPANRVRRRIQLSEEESSSAAPFGSATEGEVSEQPAAAEADISVESKPEAKSKSKKKKPARGKKTEPTQEEEDEQADGATEQPAAEGPELMPAESTPALKKATRQSARSSKLAPPTPEPTPTATPTTPRPTRAALKTASADANQSYTETAPDTAAQAPETSESPVKSAASSPQKASAVSSVKRNTRTRTPASRHTGKGKGKASTPLRSPSLGGFPEPSLDQLKKRAPAAKRTYGVLINAHGGNDDPFEFTEEQAEAKEQQAEEKTLLTETQVLSAPHDAIEPVSTPTATPAATGRTRRRAATSAKNYADLGSEVDDAAAEEEAVEPSSKQPVPAGKKSAPPKKKRGRAEEAPEVEAAAAAASSVSMGITEISLTPPSLPSPLKAAAPTIPTPPPPRSAPKRKAHSSSNADADADSQPAASPLKRTLSLKAVESLTTLKDADLSVGSASTAENEPPPKKKGKKEAAPSKSKKKATAPPPAGEDQMDTEEDTQQPEPLTTQRSGQGKPDSTSTDKEKTITKRGRNKEETAVAAAAANEETAEAPPAKRAKKGAAADSSLVFTLTGVGSKEKPHYQDIITSLGGRVLVEERPDFAKVTHIVCAAETGLKRSEKVLVALMGPQFFLHISYLDACKEAGRFLDEKEYEWVRYKDSAKDAMLPALRRWHKGRERPFANWCVAHIDLEPGKIEVFKNLLSFGGGRLVEHDNPEVTHILINTACVSAAGLKKASKAAYDAVAAILACQSDFSRRVVIARQEFLGEYLVQAGALNHQPNHEIPWPVTTTSTSTPRRASSAASTSAASPAAATQTKKTTSAARAAKQAESQDDAQPADGVEKEEDVARLPPDRSVRHSVRRKR